MQSVNKTFEVLEVIANCSNGITLEQLAKTLSYPKPTLHRICKCLTNNGYVSQRGSSSYQLTTKMLSLGYNVIHDDSLLADITPHMSELANRVGFTINLQRRDFDNVILLKKEESRSSIFHTNAHTGLTSSLYNAACGKVILANFSEEDKEKYWDVHGNDLTRFDHFCDVEIKDKVTFLEALGFVKEQKFALDGEGNESGITCIGVPLVLNGAVSYAISVSGLTPEINRHGQKKLVDELHRFSDFLSEKLAKTK